MKIRFYHWWVYKLYSRLWTPIYKANPRMLQGQIDYMTRWLDDEKERRKTELRVVK